MEIDVNSNCGTSCFICLETIPSNINNTEELINSTNLFFKYLKIRDEIQAFVCTNCGENLTKFVKLFSALEKVRLEMDYLLDSIKSVILDTNKSKPVYSGVVSVRQFILKKHLEDMMNPKLQIILERLDSSGFDKEGSPISSSDCSSDYLPSCDSDPAVPNLTGGQEGVDEKIVGKRLRKTRNRRQKINSGRINVSNSKVIKRQSQTPVSDDHDWSPPTLSLGEDDVTPVIQETEIKSGRKLKKLTTPSKAKKRYRVPEKAKCPECSKIFYSRQTMKDHVNAVHLKLKPFKCQECPKFFSDKRSLKYHISNIHSSIRPYKCDICDKSFAKTSILKNHKELVHKPRIPCTKCSKTFPNNQRLKRHDNMVHLRLKPFKCSECPRAFAQGSHLRYHNKIAHLGIKPVKQHMCEECGKAFASSTELNIHKFTPHNLPQEFLIPRKFSCEKCHRTFITAAKLKIHKRVIHPDKMFPCEICKKTFKTGVLMRFHVSSVHEKQRHHCQVEGCDLSFSTPWALRRHYKLKHPEFATEVNERHRITDYTKMVVDEQFVFECNICSTKLKTADSARAHIKFVHGPKIFLCQECGYSAAKKGNLDKHIKKYHNNTKIDEIS